MATIPLQHESEAIPRGKSLISFEEAMEKLAREDRFHATVYAMNTIMVQKGIYSPEEFQFHFRQWAQKQKK